MKYSIGKQIKRVGGSVRVMEVKSKDYWGLIRLYESRDNGGNCQDGQ